MANLSQEEIDNLLNNRSSGEEPAEQPGTGETDKKAEPDPSKMDAKPEMQDKCDEYLSAQEKDFLGEIGNICMGAAATTMYALLGHRVTITTPRVHVYESEEVLSIYKSPFVLVKVEYREGMEGKNLLLLKEQDSILITNLLMGIEEPPAEGTTLDEIHLSAMSEIMNQMIGSSATSLSNMLGIPIDITPPEAIRVGEDTDVSPFLDGSQLAIKVSFDMEIEGVLKSELMQLMTIDTGKKLAKSMLGASAGSQPEEEKPAEKPAEHPQKDSGRPNYDAPVNTPSESRAKPPAEQVNVKPAMYESFDDAEPRRGEVTNDAAINLIGDIPLQVSVELGKTKKSINDILNMGIGSVIVLDKMAGELVEVIVNGKRIARGEVVVIDENYGVRITDIVSREEST